MSEFPTMTQAEMLARSNIGKGDLEIGQDYFGSKVVKVKQDVKENDEYYYIKRFVTLQNGIILVEESRKRTSLGKIVSKQYGAAPGELEPEIKDDTEARARARAMIAKRKSEKPKQKKEKKKKKKKRESRIKDGDEEPKPRRKSVKKETSPKSKVSEPEQKLESVGRASSPSPEPMRKNPSPSPVRRAPSPSPVRRATSPSPSPVRRAPSPSPVRREPSPSPEPDRRAASPSPSPVRRATSPSPSPVRRAPSPSPVRRATSPSPSPVRRATSPSPSPVRRAPSPSPVRRAASPSPEPESKTPSVLDDDWNVFEAKVVPESEAPATVEDDEPQVGVWKHDDADDSQWKPMDVEIHKEQPLDLKEGEPYGIVALEKGAKPNSVGKLDPKLLKFFSPGKKPDSTKDRNIGFWRPKNDKDKSWKPRIQRNKEPKAEELPTWQKNPNFAPQKAIVYPPQKAPKRNSDDTPRGVWKPDSPMPDDAKPEEVILHPPSANLDNDTENGVWGLKPNAKRDENGQWKPKDLILYPPGETPDDDDECKVCGKWERPKEKAEAKGPGKLGKLENNDETPKAKKKRSVGKLKVPGAFDDSPKPAKEHRPAPKGQKTRKSKPTIDTEEEDEPKDADSWDKFKAIVVPATKQIEGLDLAKETGDPVGIWENDEDMDDTKWNPVNVVVHKKKPDDLNPEDPQGVVTAPKDVSDKPMIGKLEPEQLKFFAPGKKPNEVPGDKPLGTWVGSAFPPSSDSDGDNSQHVGNFPLWKRGKDWVPVKAIVFPRQKAPKENKVTEDPKGVWKSKDPLPDDWIPKEVFIYPKDAEIDKETPNGLWGTSLSSFPNSEGQLKPEDVLFFPPSESPDDDCKTLGRWALGDKEQWPPTREGPKKPQRSQSGIGNRGRKPGDDVPEIIGVPGKLPPWQADNDWKTGKALVYPRGKAPKSNNDDISRGTWRSKDTLPDDWIPQEVTIFPQNANIKENTPNGVWGTDPTSKPDENGQYKPKDVLFYPPSEIPEEEQIIPRGKWALEEEKKWPPTLLSPKMPLRKRSPYMLREPREKDQPKIVGKLPVNADDDWVPIKALVFPTKNAAEENKRTEHPKGVWKSKNIIPDDWIPKEVTIYPKNTPIEEDIPNGFWGTSLASAPNNDGNWNPEDVLFFPPSETPDDDCNTVGKWALGDKKEWPPSSVGPKKPRRTHSPHYAQDVGDRRKLAKDIPEEPKGVEGKLPPWQGDEDWKVGKALVYPEGKAPKENNDDISRGTWRSKDALPDDWIPQEVTIYPQNADLKHHNPNGLWGTNPASEPDETGQYKPKDVLFYPPSETPKEEEVVPRGRWELGEKEKWPPTSVTPKKPHRTPSDHLKPNENAAADDVDNKHQPKMGSLPLWQKEDDWSKDKAMVYPKSKVPKDNTDVLSKGTWKSKDPLPDDWIPQEVTIYPNSTDVNDDKPNGVWGTDRTSEPDENGQYKPKDVLFYPPSETPDDKTVPRGRWAMDREWPPKSESPKKPHRVNSKKSEKASPLLPIWQDKDDWVPTKAIVFPKSEAPIENKDEISRGIWKSKDLLPEDMVPSEVIIHPKNSDIDDASNPNGVWGTNSFSTPDENGQWKPEDVFFYPPSETPDDDCTPRGRWELGDNKPWPPTCDAPKQPHRVDSPKMEHWESPASSQHSTKDGSQAILPLPFGGSGDSRKSQNQSPSPRKGRPRLSTKPSLPSILEENWDTLPAKVVPASDKSAVEVSEDSTEPHLGTWKHNDDTDDKDWGPMDVVINKMQPEDLRPDEPHGAVAITEGTKPNLAGKLDPQKLHFFTPGKEPEASMKQVGVWRPESSAAEWPPPKKASKKTGLPSILEDNWDTLPAVVIPTSHKDADKAPEDVTEPHLGCWKQPDNTNDKDWGPLDVIISKTAPGDLASDEANGIVAIPKNVEVNDAGKLSPKDLLFFPPGEKPDPDVKEVGHWRPKKWNGDWPPPKKSVKRKTLLRNKLPKWQTDSDWIEDRAVVYDKDSAPDKNKGSVCRGSWHRDILSPDEIWADFADPQEVIIRPGSVEPEGDTPTGVWGTKADSEPDKDGQWKPRDVIFYPPKKEPGEECVPRGHWSLVGKAPDFLLASPKPTGRSRSPKLPKKKTWTGSSPTSPNVRRSVGKLKVPLLFGLPVTPGKSPMSARRKLRLSKFNKEASPLDLGKSILGDDWKRLPAKVVPKSSAKVAAPNATSSMMGIWEQSDDTTDDSNWAPMDVIVEKDKPKDLAPNEPHGVVAVKLDAEANKDTNLKSHDVLFYPPGEEPKPDGNVKKVGTWRTGKLNSPWPPANEGKPEEKAGLPRWQTDRDWIQDKAIVYAKDHAPTKNKGDVSKGVWETNESLPAGLVPQEVVIQPMGAKPQEDTRNGVWGTNSESVPDEDGQYKPADVLFYPPTKEPGDECVPIGRWALVGPASESPIAKGPKKPVRQKSPLSPRRSVAANFVSPGSFDQKGSREPTPQSARKVGKLKVPFVFGQKPDIDASISPDRSPRRHSSVIQSRTSKFTGDNSGEFEKSPRRFTSVLQSRTSKFTGDISGELEKSRGGAGVVKRSDKEEEKLEGNSNDEDKVQAPKEDNMVPKTGVKSSERGEELQPDEELEPATMELDIFPQPQGKAMRSSMSVLSNKTAKPRARAMRASVATLNPSQLELKSPSAPKKKVGKLKLPAAFSGK